MMWRPKRFDKLEALQKNRKCIERKLREARIAKNENVGLKNKQRDIEAFVKSIAAETPLKMQMSIQTERVMTKVLKHAIEQLAVNHYRRQSMDGMINVVTIRVPEICQNFAISDYDLRNFADMGHWSNPPYDKWRM